VDGQDLRLKNGASQYRAQLSFTGGGDNATYNVSGAYFNEDGIYRTRSPENKYNTNSTYERYNYRANTTMNNHAQHGALSRHRRLPHQPHAAGQHVG
jgi:hypothetical protein